MSCVTGFLVLVTTLFLWPLDLRVHVLESGIEDCTVEFPECLNDMKFLTGFDLERTRAS